MTSTTAPTTDTPTPTAPAEAPVAPPTAGTAITAPGNALDEARVRRMQEIKEARQFAAAVKGQAWAKDLNGTTIAAVAHYCAIHNLDPARHVEVLGGRIYHTGECYEERGMPLVRAGIVTYGEPDFVHDDPELKRLAALTEERARAEGYDPAIVGWALRERTRRVQARIERGLPHDATGACIYVGEVLAENGTRTPIVGFNSCGGATKVKTKRDGTKYRSDPVGDAEPTKTAQSRAKRRFWRQVVEANPTAASDMRALEVSAKVANEEIAKGLTEEAGRTGRAPGGTPSHPTPMLTVGETSYEVSDQSGSGDGSGFAAPEPLAECTEHGMYPDRLPRCPECERIEVEIAAEDNKA